MSVISLNYAVLPGDVVFPVPPAGRPAGPQAPMNSHGNEIGGSLIDPLVLQSRCTRHRCRPGQITRRNHAVDYRGGRDGFLYIIDIWRNVERIRCLFRADHAPVRQ